MTNPKLTVLMPVYNGYKYLQEAINSILNQSFADFEFLIINDGCTDNSTEVIESYSDKRIHYINRQKNRGLSYTLNEGIDLAKGIYIARMDCDDISLPTRLEKQIKFLEQNPEIGILGTSMQVISDQGMKLGLWEVANEDLNIRWVSLVRTPFVHPTIMIRKDILKQNNLYYLDVVSEDYELWTRLLQYTKGANLQETLYKYRLNKGSLTHVNHIKLLASQDEIITKNFEKFAPELNITIEQASKMRALFAGGKSSFPIQNNDIVYLIDIYLCIFNKFINSCPNNPKILNDLKCQAALSLVISVFASPSWSHMYTIKKIFSIQPEVIFLIKNIVRRVLYRINLKISYLLEV
jgi:glycosyltransferase involved in cell wall biosynthesis